MTDLEMTQLCAEAMGWKHLGAVGILRADEESNDQYAARAESAGKLWCYSGGNDWWERPDGCKVCGPCQGIPDPLHDDAQAMALQKKHRLELKWDGETCRVTGWYRGRETGCPLWTSASCADLNRAIVECVAKMQKQRKGRG